MDKYFRSAYSDIFEMEDDAHTKSSHDPDISIDDLDDLNNLEQELNQRDDSFSFDEVNLQNSVTERNTPVSRRNLLSVSPLKFFGVSPLHVEAVNPPSSFDHNLRKPSLQTRELKVEDIPTSPKQESSIRFNEDSPFRKITKPIPTETTRNSFSQTNGYLHSPQNSSNTNGFHSPKNTFLPSQSPILRSNSTSHKDDDFANRYLSATPLHDTPNDEEEPIEEEYTPYASSPPSNLFNLSDLDLTSGANEYFAPQHIKRKLFDGSPSAAASDEKNMQQKLKELFDEDDTYSDIVEITSPLLNLSKSFVSLEESLSTPYSTPNKSRESFYSPSTDSSFQSKDSSFNFDTDFSLNSSHSKYNNVASNGITHKPPTNHNTYQSTSKHSYLSSYNQYLNGINNNKPSEQTSFQNGFNHKPVEVKKEAKPSPSHTQPFQHQNGFTQKTVSSSNTFSKLVEEKKEQSKPVQRAPSREFDLAREKQILDQQQQRLEKILQSLAQRK